jgi:hypothetical protein
LKWCPISVGWSFDCSENKFIPLKKKEWRYNIFQLWEDIYIGNPGTKIDSKDIQNLINVDLWDDKTEEDDILELSKKYYDSFKKFTQSTTKLNKQDITDTDIIFKWKKFKRKILGL